MTTPHQSSPVVPAEAEQVRGPGFAVVSGSVLRRKIAEANPDTPRTNEACGDGNFVHCVDADFARELERDGPRMMRKLADWYQGGAGSGSHLAETLGLPPSNDLRFLANVLHCARHSKEIQDQLAALAE